MRTLSVGSEKLSFIHSFKAQEGEKKVTEIPIENSSPKPVDKKSNYMPLVTAALAVTSLGVSFYAMKAKGGKAEVKGEFSQNLNKDLEILTKRLDDLTAEIASKKDTPISGILEKLNGLTNDVNGLKSTASKEALMQKIENIYSSLGDLNSRISTTAGFLTENVEINSKSFPLATIYNQISGEAKTNLEKTLRTEAAVRMFGLGKALQSVPEHGMIRIPCSEYKGFASTGGMSVVPKEIAENLAKILSGRQDLQVVVDIPLYRGNVERSEIKGVYTRLFNDVRRTSDGKYEYVQTVIKEGEPPKEKLIAVLDKINTMNLKIKTDTSVTNEVVDVFMAEKKIPLDYEQIAENFLPEVKSNIAALENGGKFNFGSLEIEKNKDGSIKAFAKVKTVLYDNGKGGKFDLNPAINKASDIYNDKAISAGETERFIYFDKFFYEQMLRNEESKVPLSVDMIMGNDWHTGPIVAMTRLLTKSKEAYGLNPVLAEKIYNTPVVVIMHNAALNGGAWHSVPKHLNILFDEHAATIAKNAHIPNLAVAEKTGGVNASCFNGLMQDTGVNPQMMAVAYADYILPVSKGYAKEIATTDVFGGARRKLFEFRARYGAYNDLETLKVIANQNNIDPSRITKINPTMIGVTNGCDRANNTLTPGKAKEIAENLSLPVDTFMPYAKGVDELAWHNHNKIAAINKIKLDIDTARLSGGKNNPMQIEMPTLTDLTGVTEKTPVFVSAGRIVDQKGLDILADSLVEFYKNFKGKDYPVFYVQGIGSDPVYKNAILNAKSEVAKINPDAAKRIVFANLFNEPGRYDCAKLIADWSLMPSWFEPCGLSHKEIAQFSGAGTVVNRTGGLLEDLREGVNAIASEFNPHRSEKAQNARNFAKALEQAVEVHADDVKYRAIIEEMMSVNLDWARENGPIFDYLTILEKLGVVSSDILRKI